MSAMPGAPSIDVFRPVGATWVGAGRVMLRMLFSTGVIACVCAVQLRIMSSFGMPTLAAAASIEAVIWRAPSTLWAKASSKNGVVLLPFSSTQGVCALLR